MKRFELTDEQRAQVDAGERITLTDEQRTYVQQAQADEDAGREANTAKSHQQQLEYIGRRMRTLEQALGAMIDGEPEQARALLEDKR